MELLDEFIDSVYRVVGWCHRGENDPIHVKWVDNELATHDITWKNYADFCEWLNCYQRRAA